MKGVGKALVIGLLIYFAAFLYIALSQNCECSSMVERQLPKLDTRVRFPSFAQH